MRFWCQHAAPAPAHHAHSSITVGDYVPRPPRRCQVAVNHLSLSRAFRSPSQDDTTTRPSVRPAHGAKHRISHALCSKRQRHRHRSRERQDYNQIICAGGWSSRTDQLLASIGDYYATRCCARFHAVMLSSSWTAYTAITTISETTLRSLPSGD